MAENDKKVDIEEDDKIEEEDLSKLDDTTDWKAKAEELEQKRREDGIRSRERTKVLKAQFAESQKAKEEKKEEKSDEFNEGQLAYLVAKGIESDEDLEFTKTELKKHGGTLKELMTNDYFKANIKSRADAKAALMATPTGLKRSGGEQGDSAELAYAKYINTGTLPDDAALAEKVVQMRRTKERNDNMFTKNRVVGL